MKARIRAASDDDAQVVASFFLGLYESQHGIGSGSDIEMLQRTVSSLFSDVRPATVFVSELAGSVQGVAAVRHAEEQGAGEGAGECELLTIQSSDTIQGRGVAQTLLHHVVGTCAAQGGTAIVTDVPALDVRARGFLRREGFVALVDDADVGSSTPEATVSYRLDVTERAARGELVDKDGTAPWAGDEAPSGA